MEAWARESAHDNGCEFVGVSTYSEVEWSNGDTVYDYRAINPERIAVRVRKDGQVCGQRMKRERTGRSL